MQETKLITNEKRVELSSKLKELLKTKYETALVKAATEESPAIINFPDLDIFEPELGELLLNEPDLFFDIANEVLLDIDLPQKIVPRFVNIPDSISVRDLRSKHIGKFLQSEGIVRRSSEIRPEIMKVFWNCQDCGKKIATERKGAFIFRPVQCDSGHRREFKEAEKELIDTRWITIEEPFELTEGDKPSQVNIFLKGDLVNADGRRITDAGNRLKITGILRDVPKGKTSSVRLDFYLDANHAEPTEVGWEKVKISEKDEKEIKRLAADPMIYETLIDSIAPSLYGLREIKESVAMQLFGGVPRIMKDKMRFRGDIHVLLIGEPASGKSQILKLVPNIVPRGKYVSGKGVTGVGLTASVTKDEQFMGGWVLEAGALVLANKGLISIDEFEKMSQEDQVAMHEALEQGSISIAKASIVATLPAQTSVLAGGNPKFGRFDSKRPLREQILVPDTLLSRFDLKFLLRDKPDSEEDRKIVEHILKSRAEGDETTRPRLDPDFLRKYIAYAKDRCKPVLSDDVGKILKKFYVESRRKAQRENAPIPITLRQFEALIRLAEASAKIQLSPVVRREDADRAIRLMKYSLRQLGYDPETGAIDIDLAEGREGASERSHIRVMLDLIDEMSKKKKDIRLQDLEEEAKRQGITHPEDIIDKLKSEGVLFQPSAGFIRKV